MTALTPVLEARAVSKAFGPTPVLQDVSLDLYASRVTAVLGPNGSGKSTLNKILLGLVRPTAGDVLMHGAKVTGTDAYRASIGYMPQAPRFPEHLSALEVLSLVRSLRPEPPRPHQTSRGRTGAVGGGVDASLESLVEGVIDAFDLSGFVQRPLGVCSGGQRQRVNAAVAMLFDPEILILDEPTAGLDPVASAALKDRILVERNRGRAILVTSHVLSELEELVDDITFLLDGAVRYAGTLVALREQTGCRSLERAIAALMRSLDQPDSTTQTAQPQNAAAAGSR